MKIVLYDKVYIEKKDLENKHLLWLHKYFTKVNPLYTFYKKNKFSTYNIPQYLTLYSENDDWCIFPIGGFSHILQFAEFYNLSYEIVDKRVDGLDIDVNFNSDSVNGKPPIIWESYQQDAFNAMINNKWSHGLLQLPPGAGKTLLAINYICEVKKNTLIVMHENRLVRQWEEEIRDRIRGNYTLEIFSGDSGHKFGDITIVLIQSGHKYFHIYDEYKKFGCIIVDECHHSNSMMFDKFLNNIPAKRKFGLSGTLKRKDRMDFLIPMYLGEKIIDIPDSKTRSRITDFKVNFINTGCSFELPLRNSGNSSSNISDNFSEKNIWLYSGFDNQNSGDTEFEDNPIDFSKLYEVITGFKGFDFYKNFSREEILEAGNIGVAGERNRLILKNVKEDIDNGYKVLILTNRKAHAAWFLYSLQDLGYNGVSFSTEDTKDIDFSLLREGLHERDGFKNIDFIVSTERIAAEGLDITDLSAIYIVIPTTNQYKLKQCLGRVRRAKPNKKLPVVRDFVDSVTSSLGDFYSNKRNDYFLLAAKCRDKFYQKLRSDYYS